MAKKKSKKNKKGGAIKKAIGKLSSKIKDKKSSGGGSGIKKFASTAIKAAIPGAAAVAAAQKIASNAKAKKAASQAPLGTTASATPSRGAINIVSGSGSKVQSSGKSSSGSSRGGSSRTSSGGGDNLYSFYKSKGSSLPSISERAKEFEARGLGSASSYAGTAEQNTKLLSSLKGNKLVSQPAVQSSDMAYNAATDAMTTLQGLEQPTESTIPDIVPPTNLEDVQPTDDPFQSQIQEYEKAAEEEVKSAERVFKNLERNLDKSSRELINAISSSFSSRIAEQRLANTSASATERIAGIVSGRARYAPEIQAGILSAQETANIRNLSALNAEEAQLTSEARADAENKRIDLMVEKMNQYKIIQDRKRDLINDLYKNTIDYENLLITKAEEKRNAIKENLANQVSLANSIAGSLILELGNMDLGSEEAKAIINSRAAEAGVSPSVLVGSIKQYQNDQFNELPSIAQEYEYAKKQGYSGGFFDYMNKKKAASSIASTGGQTIDEDAANRWGLPSSTIGMSERDIIMDLTSSNVPSWFADYLKENGIQISMLTNPSFIQSEWERFRNNPDLLVFKNTIDVLKGASGDTQAGLLSGGSMTGGGFNLSADAISQALAASRL